MRRLLIPIPLIGALAVPTTAAAVEPTRDTEHVALSVPSLIGKALLGLALALLLVAPAAADPWGKEEYQAKQRPVATPHPRPDDRSGTRGVGSLSTVQPAAASASSFVWSDAAIGGGATAGALLVGSGLAVVVYRRRSRFAR